MTAIERLTENYKRLAKGKKWEDIPQVIVVGDDLFAQFESELASNLRESEKEPEPEPYGRSLFFKSFRLFKLGLPGHDIFWSYENPSCLRIQRSSEGSLQAKRPRRMEL